MSKWWRKAALALMLLLAADEMPAQAMEADELYEVMQLLMENHIAKPEEAALVQGALRMVSEQIGEGENVQPAFTAADDTAAELYNRLEQWQQQFRMEDDLLRRWAIEGMLTVLNDPHTAFFTREELLRFQASVDNQYVGFGFRIRFREGQLLIREVFPQSPAAQAGLQPGDQLVAVDGIPLTGKTYEEAYALLRGEENTEARVTIYREKEKQTKQVRMKRAYLSIPEVAGGMFAGGVGYIRLETFGSEAAIEMRNQLQAFTVNHPGMKGLILDLRDNGGGYLSAARDIASLFMEEGLLMYTVDRNGVEIATWVRNGRDIAYPVTILVNEGTASASELLAGALGDHGIADIVGTKSYGKGSAQQVVPLQDGDALKVTLHEYFTPERQVVNHVGLTPDVTVHDDIAQVVTALQRHQVQRWELRGSEEEAWINGVPFTLTEPLFQRQQAGIAVRTAVLSALLRNPAFGDSGYTLLRADDPRLAGLQWTQTDRETVLTYTAP